MPFWPNFGLNPCQLKNTNPLSLLIYTRCHIQDNATEMYAESTSRMSTRGRYTSLRLNTVKILSLDTN